MLILKLSKKANKEIFYKLNGLAGRSKFFDRLYIFWARDFLAVFLFLALVAYLWPGLVEVINLNRSRIVAVFLISCFSWLLSVLIKYSHFTPRPYVKKDAKSHILLKKHKHSPAFPSGHAAIFFAVASSLSLFVPFLSVLMFVIATIISASRVITGLHWPIDLLGGAVVGTAIPLIIYAIL